MNQLAHTLANFIRNKVVEATKGRAYDRIESRFVFHGPTPALLELVYEELTSDGGILIETADGKAITLPVLLELPSSTLGNPNPDIGVSGKCDENHLLHLRNDPRNPSFVALVPPGQHNNRSVASTTEEFGVSASNSTSHASFEEWWEDGFVQHLIVSGLKAAGIGDEGLDEAVQLVEQTASAIDEVGSGSDVRDAVWRLVSRIYSIPKASLNGLTPQQAISLVCGAPMRRAAGISTKGQLGTLEQVVDALSNGFRVGIERLCQDVDSDVQHALRQFLSHIESRCQVPTAFDRATPAFYLPTDDLEVVSPPSWWTTLSTEQWADLLAEEPDETGDLSVRCTNSVLPSSKGMPSIVRNEVRLEVSAGGQEPIAVSMERSSGGVGRKLSVPLVVTGSLAYDDASLLEQKAPITYKVTAPGFKAATAKILSIEHWAAGILVSCRVAKKLSPPKKPARRSQEGNINWETGLTLPGSGRYELVVFTSAGSTILSASGIDDDATEATEGREVLDVRSVRTGEYQIEIDADGNYQLDISFQRAAASVEICRVFVTCEEVNEEGCRSEFERLIRLNRRHLEKLESKSIVQLDRNARTSSLQGWMLEECSIGDSFRPLVIADDYASSWAPPDWTGSIGGPILSQGKFLHDPRPDKSLFQPPSGFLEARREIARRVRGVEEQSGLLESAPLGKWLASDPKFREIIEAYLDTYAAWMASDPDVACWVDAVAVAFLEPDGRTLARIPDAIVLSPLHPLRLAWQCMAQQALYLEVESDDGLPCPAASVLDADTVPDLITMSLQSPGGMEFVDYISVECSSDYWSVLWNGSRLSRLPDRSRQSPFDEAFGVTIGGIASGFSSAQVARALEDVTSLLAAKPVVSLTISSAGGATDACNDGLATWCAARFGNSERSVHRQGAGKRVLNVFDTRPSEFRPDDAAIANLAEDTDSSVRWFDEQPPNAKPDLGIIAQLDSAEPESTEVGMRSPLGQAGLIRHRIRRQLPGSFLAESWQGLQMPATGEVLADKISNCIVMLESRGEGRRGLRFAPNVHAVARMLEEKNADFVAVSSAVVDPACFLGGWIPKAYLWDYDLPAYSQRPGDTSGYYLLSQVREADRDGLRRVLSRLPGCDSLADEQVGQVLLEVARRGIPTVRGLSGDDTGATGNLGLFMAVRLLQDQFRISGNVDSLLPVLTGTTNSVSIALVIPVDPFRGHLADLSRSLGKELKDPSLSRPDLLVVGIRIDGEAVKLQLTPIEVKCRQRQAFARTDAEAALGQARALSTLLVAIEARATKSMAWRVAYQHLLLSMIGFGLRVYSQNSVVATHSSRWAGYHELIAAHILAHSSSITIDNAGRLVILDESIASDCQDFDRDGFEETIIISTKDAGRIVAGDAQPFYESVRAKVGNWRLLPPETSSTVPIRSAPVQQPHQGGDASPALPNVSGGDVAPIANPVPLATPAPTTSEVIVDQGSGIVLSLGRTVDAFEPRELSISISDTRLNQLNIGVVGDLGTGKTQLLKSLILQVARSRDSNRGISPRFLIFDYKRDYSSPDFVSATGARVVRPTRLPLNLFDTSSMGESPAPWLDRFRFFADVLDKIYSGIGPVQRDKLKNAVRSAYEAGGERGAQPTIYDVHAAYRDLLGGKSDSPMAIIDDLVDMEVFARDVRDTMPFDQFLDGVVVVSLDAMGQDDRSKNEPPRESRRLVGVSHAVVANSSCCR